MNIPEGLPWDRKSRGLQDPHPRGAETGRKPLGLGSYLPG